MKKIIAIILITGLVCSCSKKQQQFSNSIPERIISLSPSATEILFAVGAGDKIVARDEFSDFPEAVLTIPTVGGFDGKSISIETVLSFDADFVYLTGGMHDYLLPILKKQNIQVYVSSSNCIQDVLDEICDIGKITGNIDKAVAVSEKISSELEKIQANSEEIQNRQSIYWEIWDSPYMSVGKKSFINEIIEIAGGKNIFFDVQNAYPIISDETIIARNPDVIFVQNGKWSINAPETTIQLIQARNGWQNINAVKNGKIFHLDDNLISRPGPRIVEAIKEIQKAIK